MIFLKECIVKNVEQKDVLLSFSIYINFTFCKKHSFPVPIVNTIQGPQTSSRTATRQLSKLWGCWKHLTTVKTLKSHSAKTSGFFRVASLRWQDICTAFFLQTILYRFCKIYFSFECYKFGIIISIFQMRNWGMGKLSGLSQITWLQKTQESLGIFPDLFLIGWVVGSWEPMLHHPIGHLGHSESGAVTDN